MTTTVAMPAAPVTGQPFQARPVPGMPTLVVVVYHYIQDPQTARFPRLQGLTIEQFIDQLRQLQARYELATLDAAIAFLEGRYQPDRSLCLLTFDDGLSGHARDVAPILSDAGVQGVFFVTTSCLSGTVASVHKNHYLTAALGFDDYRRLFKRRLAESPVRLGPADGTRAALAYPWDSETVADFKYLLNYRLPAEWRTALVDDLFAEHLGSETAFAREIYLSTDDAREMQRAGMVIGGHSHGHTPLAALHAGAQARDLAQCAAGLRAHLLEQQHWPFSYPYGVFDGHTVAAASAAGFQSGFALAGGDNPAGRHLFAIHRVDTKDLAF